jgi:hypothetical protein
MLRWLVRLLIVGAIVGAGAFVAQRLLNRDEEWDEFDDDDESFEFQETPVEIDVPAGEGSSSMSSGGGGGSASSMQSEDGGSMAATSTMTYSGGDGSGGGMMGSENGTGGGGAAATETENTGPGIIDVKGIGSAFEARLNAVGINTIQDLANANPDSLNEQLDVPGGTATLQDWIDQAKELAGGSNGRSDQ